MKGISFTYGWIWGGVTNSLLNQDIVGGGATNQRDVETIKSLINLSFLKLLLLKRS